jgi:hypothetical protein
MREFHACFGSARRVDVLSVPLWSSDCSYEILADDDKKSM